MSDKNPTAEELAEAKSEVETKLAPEVEKLSALAHEKIIRRALSEGWSQSQAEWIDRLAQEPFIQAAIDGAPGVEALESAYDSARRQLTVGYFDHALEQGKNLYTAFLTIIDLEKQLAERRGEVPPDYPDSILMQACDAVELAAKQGLSSEDQIGAGFAVIRELAGKGLN